MNNNTAKAVVATVDIRLTKIDGLMLLDGSYCVAVISRNGVSVI
ncbi:MAG: hypothetical protein ACKPJF_02545 [Dolichospermum sp.]